VWFTRNKLLAKGLLVMVILILGSITTIGCARTGSIARGWSGTEVVGSTLFLGSMDGKLVALDTSNGSTLWEVPLETEVPARGFSCAPASTSVAIYGTPAIAGDMVYVGGYNGRIYAINSSTRLSRDRYLDEDNRQPIIGSPVVSQDTVFISSSDGKLYALDATSLDEKWQFSTGDKIWSTPAISGDTVYIGSFDKKLYAIDTTTGKEKWEFATEGAIVATPLVDSNTVYFGSFDRHLYALNATDGSLKWKSDFIAGKWFWAGAVAYNNKIYVPSLDGKVYVVDAENGEKIAEPDLGAPISSSPVVVGELVVVATESGVIYALDTDTNRENTIATLKTPKDKEEQINAPLSAGDGVVYIHTQTEQHETVYALDSTTEDTLWDISLGSQ
jgi:outer membrane protein assembly factor BamB